LQHWNSIPLLEQAHRAGHQVVTLSQVTCPGSLTEQSLLTSTAVQLLVLTLLEHETVPDSQFAVAVQRDFP
jgi:hypothetical protein